MAWAKNGTPETLGGTADSISITDLTAKEFNQFLIHDIASGSTNQQVTFNNDTSNNYAQRYSSNGAGDGTLVSKAKFDHNPNSGAFDAFHVLNCVSITGDEKLCISHTIKSNTSGAANVPYRMENAEKYVPSPDADITQVKQTNDAAGDYAANSNISALGTDFE